MMGLLTKVSGHKCMRECCACVMYRRTYLHDDIAYITWGL